MLTFLLTCLFFSIVAVHGLDGHRDRTWTADNGVHWLRDLLSISIPHARILCWGYDANTHHGSRVNSQYLHEHAYKLVSDLYLNRKQSQVRIILFISTQQPG